MAQGTGLRACPPEIEPWLGAWNWPAAGTATQTWSPVLQVEMPGWRLGPRPLTTGAWGCHFPGWACRDLNVGKVALQRDVRSETQQGTEDNGDSLTKGRVQKLQRQSCVGRARVQPACPGPTLGRPQEQAPYHPSCLLLEPPGGHTPGRPQCTGSPGRAGREGQGLPEGQREAPPSAPSVSGFPST